MFCDKNHTNFILFFYKTKNLKVLHFLSLTITQSSADQQFWLVPKPHELRLKFDLIFSRKRKTLSHISQETQRPEKEKERISVVVEWDRAPQSTNGPQSLASWASMKLAEALF